MMPPAQTPPHELLKHTLERVWSPQLRNARNVDIYLPASYTARRRYPVIYMQDGQNLSDPAIAFAGTWQLDEALSRLAERGIEPIVVGVHNTADRLVEYSPFAHPRHGGGGAERYLAFVAETVKPRVDRLFRTRPARVHTAIGGSSMGGLVSFYGWLRRPEVFGHAVAMSPSFWFGRERLFDYVRARKLPKGRLYLDVGTGEGDEALRDVRRMRALLHEKGIKRTAFEYAQAGNARHEEAAWARRIDRALEFVLRNPDR
jgi:predicted alpha/beta superfamily hydrolase